MITAEREPAGGEKTIKRACPRQRLMQIRRLDGLCADDGVENYQYLHLTILLSKVK